jgi:hypothetical protein
MFSPQLSIRDDCKPLDTNKTTSGLTFKAPYVKKITKDYILEIGYVRRIIKGGAKTAKVHSEIVS